MKPTAFSILLVALPALARPASRVVPRAATDLQTSLQLDPALIGSNLAKNGLGGNSTEAGQKASDTSKNNFINICATGNTVITNGQQIQNGSCNQVPMGFIPPVQNQPACKFSNPKNLDVIPANEPFTATMNVIGMEFGTFVNPDTNYFGAPQSLNAQQQIIGHSHIVIQTLNTLQDTTPIDPKTFAFFQGLNAAPVNGVLSANVSKGLPDGVYRMCSINTAANHQPVIGPVAQHGSFDDCVYVSASICFLSMFSCCFF
ncbi:hypothetical protein K439DRAFT_1344580 [Ramaria rubella]|nr:hypothetical protein K439DRAFT_1344580 [Ramaria rubella]